MIERRPGKLKVASIALVASSILSLAMSTEARAAGNDSGNGNTSSEYEVTEQQTKQEFFTDLINNFGEAQKNFFKYLTPVETETLKGFPGTGMIVPLQIHYAPGKLTDGSEIDYFSLCEAGEENQQGLFENCNEEANVGTYGYSYLQYDPKGNPTIGITYQAVDHGPYKGTYISVMDSETAPFKVFSFEKDKTGFSVMNLKTGETKNYDSVENPKVFGRLVDATINAAKIYYI